MHLMVSFGEKSRIKMAGNLNYGRSYVITTVLFFMSIAIFSSKISIIVTLSIYISKEEVHALSYSKACQTFLVLIISNIYSFLNFSILWKGTNLLFLPVP